MTVAELVHDHGDRWDKQDVRALRYLVGQNLTWEAIAERLGRTPGACRSKWYRTTHP